MKEPKPPYGSPSKEILQYHKHIKNIVFEALIEDEQYNKFIETVDKFSTGSLIEHLFGSDEAYIDTPGNYKDEKEDYMGNAVEHFKENYGGGGGKPDEFLLMYAWYVGNFYKVQAWLTQVETKKEKTHNDVEQS